MQTNKNLLIVGAGQYGCIAKETAEAVGDFDKIDFADNHSSLAVVRTDEIESRKEEYSMVFVSIGDCQVRLDLIEKLKRMGYEIITLIHPKAYVSPSAEIGAGCIVEPNATVQANARIEEGCLICAGAVVNHNAVVGKGCQIDCNATVPARSVVEQKTKIECGQVFKTNL